MTKSSTIFALSSAPGRAGVAVVRLSGPAARAVLASMAGPLPEPRRVAFRTIRHPETRAVIDRAVVFWFAGPASETGEDVAEFQPHGGPAIIRALLEALATIEDCRLAEPGEFARRAFLNGKLDLAEVEGLADLVNAETEAQRRQAINQAGGAISRLYDGWRSQLIEIAALTEAAIDFSDEGDVGASAFDQARAAAGPLSAALRDHLAGAHRGEIVRDGFRVALLGPPNAGKSSLLNALARRDAAIVSEEAGTTRDVIEVRLDLGGLPVIVSDTAGLRQTEGLVEREGIRRSLAAARTADLTLWLSESGLDAPPSEISRETTLKVRTKSDLLDDSSPVPNGSLPVSSVTGAGLGELIAEITRRAMAAGGDGQSLVVSQARHHAHLSDALRALETFISGPSDLELRAEDLRIAAQALGRITGRVDAEDVLDRIFSSFCIGK
jgi:tRNA modification GTPase